MILNEEDSLSKRSLFLEKDQQMEISWDNLTITAEPKPDSIFKRMLGNKVSEKQSKIIINNIKGIGKAGQFTGILGPSGSGKTTLLNFLSGRLMSDNLKIEGSLKVNNVDIESIDLIGDNVAYVMQDDILYSTFSVREALMFSANLRINDTLQNKIQKVEDIIEELGLSKCSDNVIGGEFIKGISGGERKRLSIGVELITNPSLMFLDEPTTGLDSETALNLGDGLAGIQNRKGLILFFSMMSGMSSIQSTLFLFSSEKALFRRETINHTFDAGPYFLGKSVSAFPFQVIYVTLFTSLVYFIAGMNQIYWYKYFIALGIMNLGYQTGVSYGMLISIIVPNLTLAISLAPLLIIPFILMSGFFVNTNNLSWIFKPIEYLSIFKYLYQALYINEFSDLPQFQCNSPCDPLAQAGFHESLIQNFYILFIILLFYRIISYLALKRFSKPSKCKINKVNEIEQINQNYQQEINLFH